MTNKYLYRNFLKDKRVYNLNRGYWKKMLDSLSNTLPMPLYNEHFSNGAPFYDGNPIFSAYLPSLKKSVRIIQEAPETDNIEIGAWMASIEVNNEPVKELVISLELSQEASMIAKQLIVGWLQDDWNESQIDNALGKTHS